MNLIDFDKQVFIPFLRKFSKVLGKSKMCTKQNKFVNQLWVNIKHLEELVYNILYKNEKTEVTRIIVKPNFVHHLKLKNNEINLKSNNV